MAELDAYPGDDTAQPGRLRTLCRWHAGRPDKPARGVGALPLFSPGATIPFCAFTTPPRPETVGRQVSNGCARPTNTNDQIIEFYDRVPMETRAVLNPLPAIG